MGALFITGDAGAGKSSLVKHARARGVRVALVDLQAPEELTWVVAPASVDVVAVDHATNAIAACSPPVRFAIQWALENKKPLWLVGWDRRLVEWDLTSLCIPVDQLTEGAAWLQLTRTAPTQHGIDAQIREEHGRRFLHQAYADLIQQRAADELASS